MYVETTLERPGRRRGGGLERLNDKLLMNLLVTCLTKQSGVVRLVVPQTISRRFAGANFQSKRSFV
ncbi:hypothetical protein TNIN_466601, partial [Trichonephila inaurata madagascariensis]